MSKEAVPITLKRRTPSETTAYHQGYDAGLLVCLKILNDPSVNPVEQILILLEFDTSYIHNPQFLSETKSE